MMRLSEDQKNRIKRHETPGGIPTLEPYQDSLGIWTVGYGRNLQDTVFTRAECDMMFDTDIMRAEQGAENFQFFENLNDVRKSVVIEMVYQMGPSRVGKFVKFRAAAMQQKWATAAEEMLDSRWHSQTPARAERLADLFERGEE